ncbi:MAG TPA: bifunctional adenosylcobinamide kinase/adenosylcobinamide-phosphate guanylyltransferase [Acidothermaceae bacterium]
MEITLLGTGGGSGWPHPFCTCASCAAAAREGEIRAHTSALLDGVILLDCGQDVPRSAVRLGVGLERVRHLLVTHDHHDHANGAALLWRHWTGRAEPLDVLGPRSALDALAMWLPPDQSAVVFRPLLPGEIVDLDGYAVRALAARHDSDGALIYDVTSPDGRRLLYATDTGPGFETPDDARYDVVLLEESWGDDTTHASGRHHDLTTFPLTLQRFRARGAIDADSRVAAIHLGHGNPRPSVLRDRLAAWGAELPVDGEVIRVGTPSPVRESPRRVLVLGGARSGKSAAAERMLAAEPAVCYVATSSYTDDPEWAARVAAHRARRPASWSTVETTCLAELLRSRTSDDPPLLIDCMTVWLARVIDETGLWQATTGADDALSARVRDLVEAWRTTRARVVAVSNEIGSGVVPLHPSGRRFRDELGALNARLASVSDDVLLVTAGISRSLYGSDR